MNQIACQLIQVSYSNFNRNPQRRVDKRLILSVFGEKTFYPSDKEANSTYELPPGHKSKLYATSFCNLHDFWATEFRI